MHEASFWEKHDKGIKCNLCPHGCIIPEKKAGICKARRNIKGKLVSLVYNRPISMHVDPVEKKPLFHFLPGSLVYSIGTVGCNMGCLHCQNFEISQATPDIEGIDITPEQVVERAIAARCSSIAYTYNEPTIFFEYAIDIAKLARKKGLKNILVTNGFISKDAAMEFAKYMDAANVDLKAFDDRFYRTVCKARLEPVLETLKIYKKKMWVEIANLVINGQNDSMQEIEDMCKWISAELGRDTPIHFSRAYPMYKALDITPTTPATLVGARKTALKHLDYVYLGNIQSNDGENTICPKYGETLIARSGFRVQDIQQTCSCGFKVQGLLKLPKAI